MAGDRPQRMTLGDYSSPIIPQYFTSIARPEVQAANFSYPYSLIQLIQGNLFHDLPSEDPYKYLATYIDICNTENSLRTWDEVVKFLKKYFPESKTAEGKMEISSFHQFPDESLSEALDHFHILLRKTPTHGYNEPVQLNIFIDGLRPQSKQLQDASAGGKIKLKTPEKAMELIENMATSDHAILRDHTYAPTKRSLLELTTQDATSAQNKLLSRKIEALIETLNQLPQQLQAVNPSHSFVMQVGGCHICGGTHKPGQCVVQQDPSREVNYMGIPNRHGFQGYNQEGPSGFYQRDNFLQDHYWISYPGNNFNQGGSPYQPPNQEPTLQEEIAKLEELLIQFMQKTGSHMKRTNAVIKNLEVQIGQLAEPVAERPTETFVVNTEMKPKEDCKVIFTEREEKEKKTEEDVRDEEGEKKEERERNEEKAQQLEK
ncbi:hypothetical protein HKD37_15G043550 [Glycine soja]